MEKKYYIQNEKGLFLTKDNAFVFIFPEENLLTFCSKDEALLYIENNLSDLEILYVRKFLNREK